MKVIVGAIIGAGLAVTVPVNSTPSPPPVRDAITYDPDAFQSFLTDLSIDPDVRIAVATGELARLAKLDELRRGPKYRIKFPKLRFTVNSSPFRPIRLSGSAVSNQNLVEMISAQRGMDQSYMTTVAKRESAYDNLAHAGTSSAAGLYQFTQSTWLCGLYLHRDRYTFRGIDQIYRDKDGRCHVDDPVTRIQLLSLRYDGATSTNVAVDHTIDNFNILKSYLGRAPTRTELYMLHFFGQGEGLSFIRALVTQPGAPAYLVTPKAANSNRSLFFAKGNYPLTVYDVYLGFDRTFSAS